MVFSTLTSSAEKAAAPERLISIASEITIAANLENLLIFLSFTPSSFFTVGYNTHFMSQGQDLSHNVHRLFIIISHILCGETLENSDII